MSPDRDRRPPVEHQAHPIARDPQAGLCVTSRPGRTDAQRGFMRITSHYRGDGSFIENLLYQEEAGRVIGWMLRSYESAFGRPFIV